MSQYDYFKRKGIMNSGKGIINQEKVNHTKLKIKNFRFKLRCVEFIIIS
jgi:hypothetical protein